MARKGILTSSATPTAPRRVPPQTVPRGAVGALQSSLSKLQENAIQEIDPERIYDAGVTDRLGPDGAADTSLRESLKTYGQQVPVLVRPRAGHPGTYDIVYGRRRVQALRSLGLPVKAMVRQLDDAALVLAQGQENTARRDLSFIEKASFAAQLDALDYGRETICAALSIDLPMVSRMLKVGRAFEVDFLRQIGSAPGIGRERWLKLVTALAGQGARDRVAAQVHLLQGIDSSDARFEQVLVWAEDRDNAAPLKPAKAQTRKVKSEAGYVIGQVRQSAAGLTVTIPAGDAPAFPDWVAAQGEALLHDLYARWLVERSRSMVSKEARSKEQGTKD